MFSQIRSNLEEGVREPIARNKNEFNKQDKEVPRGDDLTDPGKDKQRLLFKAQYEKTCVSPEVILNYESVDQGYTCACSFVHAYTHEQQCIRHRPIS